MSNIRDEKEFEERSDYIDDSNLEIWNVSNDHFNMIQQKLIGVGAKLLVGPRGTGKTHQMKIAHLSCIKSKDKPLSIFVSFSKYYHLEPYLTKAPNAIQIFHTWVLCKIILSSYTLLEEMKLEVPLFTEENNQFSKDNISVFVSKAEKLSASQITSDPLISNLSISTVLNTLENLAAKLKRKRVILMLDDAALSLTPDYLVEFFDIVRSLKTKNISPKASVYPGTTQYSPRFHVGQDAEMVQCWLSVEDNTYSAFMNTLIAKRFAEYTDGINTEIIEIFKYASFGVPRAFISMLRNFKTTGKSRTTQAQYNFVIEQQAKFLESEYQSIAQKLIQYKSIIKTGYDLFKKIIEEIRRDNLTQINTKNIVLGIPSDDIASIKLMSRMFRFLIEAGLLYEDISVRHGSDKNTGERREYRRFIPHLLFLIQNRTFNKTQGTGFSETVKNIQLPARKQPMRRSISNLLTEENRNRIDLDLPPCQSCKVPRLNVEQRFCHNCGKELINQSAFEQCMKISVDMLPITSWQKKKVKENKLNTVGDFMALQDPGTELRKIHQVGQKRSQRIYYEVLKTVDEFLA